MDSTQLTAADTSGAMPTMQDFSVPATAGGSPGNWWMNDQGGSMNNSAFPQHG